MHINDAITTLETALTNPSVTITFNGQELSDQTKVACIKWVREQTSLLLEDVRQKVDELWQSLIDAQSERTVFVDTIINSVHDAYSNAAPAQVEDKKELLKMLKAFRSATSAKANRRSLELQGLAAPEQDAS